MVQLLQESLLAPQLPYDQAVKWPEVAEAGTSNHSGGYQA